MRKVATNRREARSVSGWPGAVCSYGSFEEFLAVPQVVTGLHSITDGREIVDFHYTDSGAPNLAVFFHGAVRGELIADLKLPILSGLKVPLGAEADRLMLSDSTMAVHRNLRLGWFCGTRRFNLVSRIDQILAKLTAQRSYRRVILLGGSQGGFAALRASRRLPGSVALIWNPQTSIKKFFYPARVQDFAHYCFAAPTIDAIPPVFQVDREMDLTQSYAAHPASNYVFYMQNRCDLEHLDDHAIPFSAALGFQGPSVLGVNRLSERVTMALGDWVGGHSLPDRDSVTAVAGLILDQKTPLEDLFAGDGFRNILPDSYYAQITPEERADLSAGPTATGSTASETALEPASVAQSPDQSKPVIASRLMLKSEEAAFLQASMKAVARRSWYVEYGASGTVKMARSVGFAHIMALDSDAPRLKRILQKFGPTKASRLQTLHADVGPVDAQGIPVDTSGARRWSNYVLKPWYAPPDGAEMPDFIFVNGAFRLACCFYAAMRCALHPELSPPKIMMRTAGRNPTQHEQMLRHFDIVSQVGSLMLLQGKQSPDVDRLLQDLSLKMMSPV